MATTNRDFKVKHGLSVAEGGTFGSPVTVGTPTQNTHAATKLYVDSKPVFVPAQSTQPASPVDGQLWFDTNTKHLSIYSEDFVEWVMIATFEDTANLREHIHDTSIDGSGLIVSTFVSGGAYNEPGVLVSAGLYNTASWEETWIGGEATDNFN